MKKCHSLRHPQFLLTLALVISSCTQQNPVLTVSGGRIQGVHSDGTPDVLIFKGIPYAAPPVGELRWQAPQPVSQWEDVRICDTFGPIAPQPGNKPGTFYGDEFYWAGTPAENEDCLYLNVWAPAFTVGKPEAKLPVALWIHGGAYMNGYGYEVTMDGEAWARRGVILVTINYRLGALGFLSHPELTAEQGQSGNYGTMDQIAALQWVCDNISQFGGDPSRITVFGQSAGAMSVKTLMVAPGSRNLIAGVIIQSGGGLDTRGLSPENDVPQAFYDAQGKEAMDKAGLETLAALRAASPEAILQAGGWFFPHLDGEVLTQTFEEAVLRGDSAKVPVMIGYNKDDMGMLGGAAVDRFCAVWDSLGHPVYEYEFLRELPTDEAHPASAAGAFHSAELWYMFGTLDRSWRPFTEADHALSERMLDAWTAFCRDRQPGWPAFRHDAPYKEIFDITISTD